MTLTDFYDLQEFFVVLFGPILQWIFVGIAMAVTGLLVLITGLTLLRRMLGTELGQRQKPMSE